MFSHLTAIEIFIPFNAQQKYLLSDGRISVCLLCFQPRKWTDLQSAEGHKDAAHTCDDVKVKGSEMTLTKSRAAVAQWELKMNREMELNPGSCFIVWNVFRSLLDNAVSLCAVLVFLAAACERYIWPSLLNDTDFYGKGVNILRPQTEHVIPHCVIVTSKAT